MLSARQLLLYMHAPPVQCLTEGPDAPNSKCDSIVLATCVSVVIFEAVPYLGIYFASSRSLKCTLDMATFVLQDC